MDWTLQKQLFLGFFRAGIFGYGGGPASIPLVHKEVVQGYGWMSDEEFYDILAIGNTLPGPIMTKMAGYIGYRTGGVTGMFSALTASVFPTVVLMIVLIGALLSFQSSPIVQGMTSAIAPVVGVMMLTLTYNTLKSTKGRTGWLFVTVFTVLSIVVLELLNIHPAFWIALLLIIGVMYWRKPASPEE
ncbi:chromate transporter [Salibacterium qingdaonense]|uniref:Chromate transporter n=1 Tax=Salibacterium qingdaonense TaxID=266892 RepID=A0A1I4HXE0_9BACI|nr:chromate transporter [Salibacterium qingdaonense]SFL46829.1 chromate transporter [Salibacterium qingdaonense]